MVMPRDAVLTRAASVMFTPVGRRIPTSVASISTARGMTATTTRIPATTTTRVFLESSRRTPPVRLWGRSALRPFAPVTSCSAASWVHQNAGITPLCPAANKRWKSTTTTASSDSASGGATSQNESSWIRRCLKRVAAIYQTMKRYRRTLLKAIAALWLGIFGWFGYAYWKHGWEGILERAAVVVEWLVYLAEFLPEFVTKRLPVLSRVTKVVDRVEAVHEKIEKTKERVDSKKQALKEKAAEKRADLAQWNEERVTLLRRVLTIFGGAASTFKLVQMISMLPTPTAVRWIAEYDACVPALQRATKWVSVASGTTALCYKLCC